MTMRTGNHCALTGVILGPALLVMGLCFSATGAEPPGKQIPDAARIMVIRAEKAFSAGKLKEAEEDYKEAVKIAPNSPRLLVSLAAVETRLGKISESRNLLRDALGMDLDNGAAWLLMGMNALEEKLDEEAVASLIQATLHDPGNPRAHNYLGIAAGHRGWNDVSEKELRKAVELDPAYADANFNLAVFYLGRTPPLAELARRHYQRALDLGIRRDPAVESQLNKAASNPVTPP